MGKIYSSIDKLAQDMARKQKIAIQKTTARVEEEVKQIIRRNFVNWYYEWGPPTMYDRTYQLYNSIGVKVYYKETNTGYYMTINFDAGNGYGPDKMNHSPYMVTVTWTTKNGEKHTGEYCYGEERDDKKEKRIFENFLRDVHGFAGEGSFANDAGYAMFIDMAYNDLQQWVNKNAQRILTEEMQKLLK